MTEDLVHHFLELGNKKLTTLLEGVSPDVSPDNTREQNCKIIPRKNQEKFRNRQIREREREIKNIPKGIINKRKSSLNFNFPDTPPYTPRRDDFLRFLQLSLSTPVQDDFSRCLQPSSHFHEPKNQEKQVFYFLMERNLKVCYP